MKSDAKSVSDYITTLAFPHPQVDIMEEFHESTKIYRQTIEIDGLWIGAYLSDPRALLETASNKKRYFLSEKIIFPEPEAVPGSLAASLQTRSTVSRFEQRQLSLKQLSNLLAASMKPTRYSLVDADRGLKLHKRPYASGGGLYPIEVYPVFLAVDGYGPIVTHYDSINHQLAIIDRPADASTILESVSDVEERLAAASVIFLMTAVLPRTTVKYGTRGFRFAMIEVGEIAQNISLCAESLGLTTLPWGGYFDDEVSSLLKIDGNQEVPVHCLSIGYAR